MERKVLFYSGNGNHQLGARILNALREYRGDNSVFSHIDCDFFPDGDFDTHIPRFADIEGKPVVFYQSIFEHKFFEEALELIWAIKKQYKAAYLIAIIPFIIFRRQDHEEKLDEICRLRMAIDRLRHAGVDEIITVSPHSPKMKQFCDEFSIKMWEIDPSPLFAATIKTYLETVPTIYSPDEGSISRAVALAKLSDSRVIFSLKNRGLNNEITIKPEEESEITRIISYYQEEKKFSKIYYADADYINGASIVITEDETATGGTANKTGQRLKNLGAKELLLLASHGVLCPGFRRKLFENDTFDKVILGDTIPRDYEKRTGGKIHDICFAELIAQTLYKRLQALA